MPIYHLYTKTLITSGLKYLGVTSKDPFVYNGSGVYWCQQIANYKDKIKTEILLKTQNLKELRETGLFYSKLWNVVESCEWANRIPEGGNGILSSYRKAFIKEYNSMFLQHRLEVLPLYDMLGVGDIDDIEAYELLMDYKTTLKG